jgi:hypothetical protein
MTATKDFEYVIRVLKSCETKEQIKVSKKMFENFKNKWKNDLDCFEMIEFMFKFESKRKKYKEKLC